MYLNFRKKININIEYILCSLFLLLSPSKLLAETNQSSVTNSAAPSASSVTTGGTNINYQTNNAYNNEMGFAPGVFCRTPTLYFGGNYGESWLNANDGVTRSGNVNESYSLNAGILVPFGSSVQDDCKSLVNAISLDRQISSQLSMLKTCDDLYKKNIPVDPIKFPLLASCLDYEPKEAKKEDRNESDKDQMNIKRNTVSSDKPKLTPKTDRVL